jgi:HlyD family secretion protein
MIRRLLWLPLVFALAACGSSGKKAEVFTGTIEVTDVDVASTVPGRLVTVAVDKGSPVKAGDLLFAIDATTLEAQRDAAKGASDAAHAAIETMRAQQGTANAQVEWAQRESKRAHSMVEAGVGTDQQVSQGEGQYKVASAQSNAAGRAVAQAEAVASQADAALRALEKQVSDSRVLSPVDGVVLSRNREPGEVVAAGASVVTLGDLAHPKLRIYVPLKTLETISLGTRAEIRIDAEPDTTWPGQVTWISPDAEFTPRDILTPEERVKQVFAVDVAIEPKPGIHPGIPADATFVRP